MRIMKLFIGFLLLLLFSACESHQLKSGEKVAQTDKKNEKEAVKEKTEHELQSLQPIEINSQSFQTISAWFDEASVLYINNDEHGSEVIRHNLESGSDTIFYQTNDPIVQLAENPDRTIFLLHSTSSSRQAALMFVDKNGNELFRWEIPAFDLQYIWNPYHQSELFVTAFAEDWSYTSYIVDAKEQKVVKSPYQIPFIQWSGKQRFTYIHWNNDEPELSAPLYEVDLQNKKVEKLAEHAIGNGNMSSFIMYLEEDQDNKGFGRYVFLRSSSKQKVFTKRAPLASDNAQWVFPFYGYDKTKHFVYVFIPNKPMETGLFKLIQINPLSGRETPILSNVSNYPIKLSPSGRYALYGPRLENLIDVKKRKVFSIIQ